MKRKALKDFIRENRDEIANITIQRSKLKPWRELTEQAARLIAREERDSESLGKAATIGGVPDYPRAATLAVDALVVEVGAVRQRKAKSR